MAYLLEIVIYMAREIDHDTVIGGGYVYYLNYYFLEYGSENLWLKGYPVLLI